MAQMPLVSIKKMKNKELYSQRATLSEKSY